MTRRGLLALLPASIPLRGAPAAGPGFERIDTHTHIHRRAPALLAAMERGGWKALSICDSRAVGDETSVLDEMIRGTADAYAHSNGRLAWAATFDPRGFERADFGAQAIAGLRTCFDQGAIAVKIWKNIGMGIRTRDGSYVMPDNPVFAPVFDAIEWAGKTLVAHMADPNAAWAPLDSGGPDMGYFKSHPEWSMSGKPGAPAKEAILAARDRVLKRHPKLRVIGCHLGSNEEDLGLLAKRLDAYPNFAVDLAARVRYLMRGDRNAVTRFLTRYSDRILYGTDFTLGANDESAAKSFLAQHEQEWRFLATADTIAFRNGEQRGLALPEAVARKIFRENAVRWLPGIAG